MNKKFKYLIHGLTMMVIFLLAPVVSASHLLTPNCGNLVLDPTGLGGTTETFDACLLTGENSPTVGVVLLHGRTLQPDGPVIEELRTSLHNAGYTTLSIENPSADPVEDSSGFGGYLADSASSDPYVFPETYARVYSAINHLKSIGVQEVVIAGFSMGSRFAAATVARISNPDLPIIGLVGVGMYNTSATDPLDHDFTLDEVTVPVLDIYGNTDSNATLDEAGRVNAYNKGTGTSYTQIELNCSAVSSTNCHHLDNLKGDDSKPLEQAVNVWMACNAPLATADCRHAVALTSDGTMDATNSGTDSAGDFLGSINYFFILLFLFTLAFRVTYRKH